MTWRDFGILLRQASNEWLADGAPRLGAAIAFYTVFSLAPVLVIAVSLAGIVFGDEAARGQIAHQIDELVGPEGGKAIQAMLAGAKFPSTGIVATVFGVAALLIGAIGVFGELQDSMNTIWGVKPRPQQTWWQLIRYRLLSFVMVLVIAFLLLVLLVASAVTSAALSWIRDWEMVWLSSAIDFTLSILTITALFATIYKVLPDAQIAWRDVWLGAAVTALLFVAGKWLIGLYLGRSAVASAYGAAGSLAVLLLWLYYSAQIFLFGAELTQVYANRFGTGVRPSYQAADADTLSCDSAKT